jgi:glycosyltransferase involved in cell wall biosynthesis
MVYSQIPTVQLSITGDHGGLPLPEVKGVTLTGMVPDVRPLIANATVSIAPILTGGGSRLKILEAMALRTPVVATSKGAEGLDVQDREHLIIADTPDLFAKAILDLFQQPELREHICENAYRLVRDNYDWEVVHPAFLRVVDQVVSKSK